MSDDDLTLRVMTCTRSGNSYLLSNPRVIGGWKEVRFSRGVERCPSDFLVSLTEKYPSQDPPDMQIQPGDYCEVFLGADRVSTGWIDRYMPRIAPGEHAITVSGRSKCSDLVDCSAVYEGFQIVNSRVLDVAQKLCAPFGITAALDPSANQGGLLPQIVILAGETAYDVLERICRYRALLLYDTPDGNLLISGIGSGRAASGFQEGVNAERASAIYSMDQRFSDYYAIYQGIDQFSDAGGAPNQIAHFTDSGVPRYRPRVVISENIIGGSDVAGQRAQWEAARRLGRSFGVTITTDTWRDSAGALYTPNTLAPLMFPSLKLGSVTDPKLWVIAEVTYRKGREGTHCDLFMMPPQAFYQQPFVWVQYGSDQTIKN